MLSNGFLRGTRTTRRLLRRLLIYCGCRIALSRGLSPKLILRLLGILPCNTGLLSRRFLLLGRIKGLTICDLCRVT